MMDVSGTSLYVASVFFYIGLLLMLASGWTITYQDMTDNENGLIYGTVVFIVVSLMSYLNKF